MAFDEADVVRVRQLMSGRSDVVEKRIVGGGWGFMVGGHLCCGVSTRGLTVRVGAAEMDDALTRQHVRRLEFGGRPTAASSSSNRLATAPTTPSSSGSSEGSASSTRWGDRSMPVSTGVAPTSTAANTAMTRATPPSFMHTSSHIPSAGASGKLPSPQRRSPIPEGGGDEP